jgi:hypothetical protein
MKAVDWKRLSTSVLTRTNASWGWSKALAYIQPANWVVHGVLAEDSGNQQGEFYLWVVRMPLMVPAEGVVDLTWSDRFGGASLTYKIGSPSVADAIRGAAALAIAGERGDGLLLNPSGGVDNVRMHESRAYGLLLSGDEGSALEVLRRVERYDARFPWEKDMIDRVVAVSALIESHRGAEAIEQLRLWRLENCESLGLVCE